MFTDEIRNSLRDAVKVKVTEFVNKKNLTSLHLLLLGYNSKGIFNLAKSTDTWEYNYRIVPGALEYLARDNARRGSSTVPNPLNLGLKREQISCGKALNLDRGDTEHIKEFVKNLPQWFELGCKYGWGDMKKTECVRNTWNTPVLGVLYELIFKKVPNLEVLKDALKTKAFTPQCQFNLCYGLPQKKHKWLTEISRARAIDNLVNGKPAIPSLRIEADDIVVKASSELEDESFTFTTISTSRE